MHFKMNQPSLTDKDNEDHPLNDVVYYYISDDIHTTGGQTVPDGVKNLVPSGSYVNDNDISLLISTENMTNGDSEEVENIWAEISYQYRLPSAEGKDYNDWSMGWNDNADLSGCDPESVSAANGRCKMIVGAKSLMNKEDPKSKKSSGYAKITFDTGAMYEASEDYSGLYYGGL